MLRQKWSRGQVEAGLANLSTIIDTYGGRIWAENRAGGGAVFCFTLPLIKARTA